jgi:hypothetical protein
VVSLTSLSIRSTYPQYEKDVNKMRGDLNDIQIPLGETEKRKPVIDDIIRNAIYYHVEKRVRKGWAGKITGMIINRPEVELRDTVATWEAFVQIVTEAEEALDAYLKLNVRRDPQPCQEGYLVTLIQADPRS